MKETSYLKHSEKVGGIEGNGGKGYDYYITQSRRYSVLKTAQLNGFMAVFLRAIASSFSPDN